MIQVRCNQTGDLAEALTERAAFVTARALMEDAHAAHPYQGYEATCTFIVDGEPVLAGIGQPAIWAALGREES